jgi:hypothetical protein
VSYPEWAFSPEVNPCPIPPLVEGQSVAIGATSHLIASMRPREPVLAKETDGGLQAGGVPKHALSLIDGNLLILVIEGTRSVGCGSRQELGRKSGGRSMRRKINGLTVHPSSSTLVAKDNSSSGLPMVSPL